MKRMALRRRCRKQKQSAELEPRGRRGGPSGAEYLLLRGSAPKCSREAPETLRMKPGSLKSSILDYAQNAIFLEDVSGAFAEQLNINIEAPLTEYA